MAEPGSWIDHPAPASDEFRDGRPLVTGSTTCFDTPLGSLVRGRDSPPGRNRLVGECKVKRRFIPFCGQLLLRFEVLGSLASVVAPMHYRPSFTRLLRCACRLQMRRSGVHVAWLVRTALGDQDQP